MVHADASNFGDGVSKKDAYAQVLEQARGLFYEQRNWVCNLSNAASLLWHCLHALPSPSNKVNWAGFYVLDPKFTTSSTSSSPSSSTSSLPPKQQLILGPFQGKVACQTIRFGKGVCGTAAEEKRTMLVDDVEEFPGHIACDGDSRSEIVVPILQDGKVVAIIDIDCTVTHGFDQQDKDALEELALLIAESCDF